MNDITQNNIERAQQVLSRYNTTAVILDDAWDISGGLVDNCVYARLVTDKNDKLCLSTAALCWDQDDVQAMIEAVTKINDCLIELNEIDTELVR